MPLTPDPARPEASTPTSPFVVVCAVVVPILVAASLANCVSDDSATPSCANGGLSCAGDASFDAALGFPDAPGVIASDAGGNAPDAALSSPDAGLGVSDAQVPDGAPPVDGGIQPLKLADATNPYFLTQGGGFVYWSATGNVSRVSINGGPVTTITPTSTATAMTADATNAYWVSSDGYVYQVAHTSTTPLRLGTALVQASVIATDGQYVYWSEDGINSSFVRVPIGGGDAGGITPQDLSYPSGIAFTGGATYLAIANTGSGTSPGTINMLPGDGGNPIALLSGRTGPQQLTTDGTRLYWVEDTGLTPDAIYSSAFDGGALVTFTQNELHPKIVVDGAWLYYTDTEYVMKRPADGSGTPTKLYAVGYPWAVAQDANNLYWADRTGNAIYKGAKY